MNLSLTTIINKPVSSNCHIFADVETKHCIIIDPGSEDGLLIDEKIKLFQLIPDQIILTHEHYDHIWSCQYLIDKYGIPIVCTKKCSEALGDSRKNLSLFFDYRKAFSCPTVSILIDDENRSCLSWQCHSLQFYPASGHSMGDLLVIIDNFLITGDLLIKDLKTVTKLKCGSKDKLMQTLALIETFKGRGLTVCPGHGDCFSLDNYDLKKAL